MPIWFLHQRRLLTTLFWSTVSECEFKERGELSTEVSLSVRGSFWERSSVSSRFSLSNFHKVPGAVPDCTRASEFWRNFSTFDKAPSIRLSVLLISWDNILLTLPSTLSESCVVYFTHWLWGHLYLARTCAKRALCGFFVDCRIFILFSNLSLWKKNNWTASTTETSSFLSAS